MEDPHITRNLITETALTQSYIFFKGHMEFVRRLERVTDENKKDVSAAIRFTSRSVNRLSETRAEITDLKAEKCYALVWKYEFDWSLDLPLEELMGEVTEEKQQIAFFLDISAGGTLVESRFGHRREKDVLRKYFENAVLYRNLVLAPTETEFSNISLNVIPVATVIKQSVNVRFTVSDKDCRIDVTGNQGFDNFPGSRINAVLDGKHSVELKKGKRRGDRKYSGVIPVLEDNISHTLKIKSDISGGELEYLNVNFTHNFSSIVTKMQEMNRELKEEKEKTRKLEKELCSIKNSKSWRVTKPLRDVANMVRKIRR